MIKGLADGIQSIQEWGWRSALSSAGLIMAGLTVLVGVGLVIALLLGGKLGTLGLYAALAAIGITIMAVILLLRQNELAVMIIIAVQVYVDWYWGLHIVSVTMGLGLLVVFFLARSPRYPWAEPRALWLWALFLALALFPAIRGATNAYDAAFYFPNIFFGALILFWLGTLIARDVASVYRFFNVLSAFGTILAVVSIIQIVTGKLLLGSSRFDSFLTRVSNYTLYEDPSAHRLGSFFVDPNWSGTCFAMLLFIPLGLSAASSSFSKKALYLSQALIILPPLLFTFSIGAWISSVAGIVIFIVLVGRMNYRLQIVLFVVIAAVVLLFGFQTQINLLLQRASDPNELLLRSGAWQTAIRVIEAFPLTGVGLGFDIYVRSAEPYRVPTEWIPLVHPHNSYLELGAMAGLPVLIVFVALVLLAMWQALRIWMLVDVRTRSLFAGGIAAVMALSVNSWSINAWTLPPLAAIGWLILGVLSSPLLKKSLSNRKAQRGSDTNTQNP